jgi:precorrin-6B methylase 2
LSIEKFLLHILKIIRGQRPEKLKRIPEKLRRIFIAGGAGASGGTRSASDKKDAAGEAGSIFC